MLRVYPGVGTHPEMAWNLINSSPECPVMKIKILPSAKRDAEKGKEKRRCPTQQKRVRFGDFVQKSNLQFYL